MSLSDLPTELLLRILDNFRLYSRDDPVTSYLDDISRHDEEAHTNKHALLALCLVNKRIGDLAAQDLWHAITPAYLTDESSDYIMTDSDYRAAPRVDFPWSQGLAIRIMLKHPRFQATQVLWIMHSSLAHCLGTTLPLLRNLRILHIHCQALTRSGMSDSLKSLLAISKALEQLSGITLYCQETRPAGIFKFLASLPSTRTYDGLRMVDPSFADQGPVVDKSLRFKSLHIDREWSPSPYHSLTFLSKFEHSVMTHITITFGIEEPPADYFRRLVNIGWPSLRQLSLRGEDDVFDSFDGWGDEAKVPQLRSLEVVGSILTSEIRLEDTAASGNFLELLLTSMPSTIHRLCLDNALAGDDCLGFAVLLRLLRHPRGPLHNVTSICFPLLRMYPRVVHSWKIKSVESALKSAGEFVEIAEAYGVRIEPADIQQRLQSLLLAMRERHYSEE